MPLMTFTDPTAPPPATPVTGAGPAITTLGINPTMSSSDNVGGIYDPGKESATNIGMDTHNTGNAVSNTWQDFLGSILGPAGLMASLVTSPVTAPATIAAGLIGAHDGKFGSYADLLPDSVKDAIGSVKDSLGIGDAPMTPATSTPTNVNPTLLDSVLAAPTTGAPGTSMAQAGSIDTSASPGAAGMGGTDPSGAAAAGGGAPGGAEGPGGEAEGNYHTGGKVTEPTAKVEGGEYVIKKDSTAIAGDKNLDRINRMSKLKPAQQQKIRVAMEALLDKHMGSMDPVAGSGAGASMAMGAGGAGAA